MFIVQVFMFMLITFGENRAPWSWRRGFPTSGTRYLSYIFDQDADVVAMRIILTSINAIKKYFIQFLMKVIYLTNILETLLFLTLFMLFLFSFFTSV